MQPVRRQDTGRRDGGLAVTVPAERNLVAETRAAFVRDTDEHELIIIRDNELYRHLRFKQPHTITYYFDLLTWPGYLAITGDCGTFIFSRTRDMFEFFAPPPSPAAHPRGFDDVKWGINPGYWSEKLQAPEPAAAERFSEPLFRKYVLEWFDDASRGMTESEKRALRGDLDYEVLDRFPGSEAEAMMTLNEFEHCGLRIREAYEWNMRDWDWRFLWCCWAIVWGIDQYRSATAEAS